MNQLAILYPVFVQVALVITVCGLMAVARGRAIRKLQGQRSNPELAAGKLVWPEDARKRAANFSNQFEIPVLFYAVVAFALITKGVDTTMVALAWLFVLARIAHAAIHVGPNVVPWRTAVFALSVLAVALMWIKLFLHVVGTAGIAA